MSLTLLYLSSYISILHFTYFIFLCPRGPSPSLGSTFTSHCGCGCGNRMHCRPVAEWSWCGALTFPASLWTVVDRNELEHKEFDLACSVPFWSRASARLSRRDDLLFPLRADQYPLTAMTACLALLCSALPLFYVLLEFSILTYFLSLFILCLNP